MTIFKCFILFDLKSKPEDVQFVVMWDEEKQQTSQFKKLEPENIWQVYCPFLILKGTRTPSTKKTLIFSTQ